MRFDRDASYATPPPLVNVTDPQAAVDRICELLDDEPALDDLAARGPAWIDANHAARTVATSVLDDYRRTGQTPD
jgi:hypothetical protein